MPNPRKVVIAYHAVGGGDCPAIVGSFPISLDRFAAQVTGLRERGWQVGRLSQILEPVDRDTVYLTGDDGTIDWARNVLPWAEREGVPTHTGVITGVWRDEPIFPIAHKVQVMLAVRKSNDLPRPKLTAEQAAYIDKIYAYETDPNRRYLKGACNVLFSYEQAQAFLGTLDYDCLKLLVERFAQPADYNRLTLAEVGVHTVRHNAYDGDAASYYATEILPCLATLMQRCQRVNRVFTLPVKPKDGVSLAPLCETLRRHGFTGMCHNPGEWNQQDFIVCRVDAKDVESFFGLPEWKD
ncbi:MAG: hypothetical protein PHU85_14795 [Phycisphaerae bacterium]|nr:hypothetical protein [Phycisphaerae bacterium]